MGFVKNGYSLLCVISVQIYFLRVHVKSWRLFDEMSERNIIPWSLLNSGYAYNGEAAGARCLFRETSDDRTFDLDGPAAVGVLDSCGGVVGNSHEGSIHGHGT